MDLIDRAELLKNDEVTEWLSNDAIRTGKMLKAFSELFVKKVESAQKVDAVPMSVIEEIKAEILNSEVKVVGYVNTERVLQIIDEKVKEHETMRKDEFPIIDKHVKNEIIKVLNEIKGTLENAEYEYSYPLELDYAVMIIDGKIEELQNDE